MDANQVMLEAQKIATYGTLAAALIGGIIGFLGSLLAVSINTRAERKKLLLQLGTEMGIKHWDTLFKDLQEKTNKGASGVITPPYVYVNFNIKVLELLAEGKLTPETLEKINNENIKIIEKISTKSE